MRPPRGQAAVETALLLPLTVFVALGILQLFLLLQARLLTEYAAFRATRGAAVAQGSCPRMLHAALLSVLPAFTRTDSPEALARELGRRRLNRFLFDRDQGHDGEVLWLRQSAPRPFSGADQPDFDDPDAGLDRVTVDLVFWYPMRIPFANLVMAKLFLATFGLAPAGRDPFLPSRPGGVAATAVLDDSIGAELDARVARGQYVFPLQATWAMRRMTPARADALGHGGCR